MKERFADREIAVDLIYKNEFSTMDDLWCEGSPDMSVENQKLVLKTTFDRSPDCRFVMTAFIRKIFDGDLLVSFDAQDIDDQPHRNFNFFLHTTNGDGRDVYETRNERNGDYPNYHTMNNYLFTALNSDKTNPDGSSQFRFRMRRNPGFLLMKEAFGYRCEAQRWYGFKYLLSNGTVSMTIDDLPEQTYQWRDPDPLRSGYLGVRTYMSHLSIRRLKVFRVTDTISAAV
ncbi:MAG: DUF1961 family protein [Planctomycetota bacterium]